MKNLRILFHKWHNWVGIFLAIPVCIASITAILLAFKDELGFDKIVLSTKYIPGYYIETGKNSIIEDAGNVKAIKLINDTLYIGTKSGLIKSANGKVWIENKLLGVEVRKIEKFNGSLLVAGNKGIWKKENIGWVQLYVGDIHDVGVGEDGRLYAALGKQGIIFTEDNFKTTSNKIDLFIKEKLNNPEFIFNKMIEKRSNVTMKELILDMHTGRAFLGKGGIWIWTSIVASSIILLVLTGTYLWVRKKLIRRKN